MLLFSFRGKMTDSNKHPQSKTVLKETTNKGFIHRHRVEDSRQEVLLEINFNHKGAIQHNTLFTWDLIREVIALLHYLVGAAWIHFETLFCKRLYYRIYSLIRRTIFYEKICLFDENLLKIRGASYNRVFLHNDCVIQTTRPS